MIAVSLLLLFYIYNHIWQTIEIKTGLKYITYTTSPHFSLFFDLAKLVFTHHHLIALPRQSNCMQMYRFNQKN